MVDPADVAKAKAEIDRVYTTLDRRDHFQLLGVDRDTGAEQLRQSFHHQAKRWHTDNFAGMDLGSRQKKLDEIFSRINEAYETLSDPKAREEYIVLLERQQAGLSTDVNSILRAEALVDEAVAEIRRRGWQAAIDKLHEARELNPDDPLYDVHLGWAMFNKDRSDDKKVARAEMVIKEAVKRQQSLPLAYQHLGQISFDKERYDEARRWWKKCLEWDKKNVDALRGLRLINTREEKKNKGLGALFNKLLGK